MENYQLIVGLVVHWTHGGWHGTDIITKFSNRFVWHKTYPLKKNDIKTYRKSKSKFLKDYSIYVDDCQWNCKDIGKIKEII